MAKLFGVRTSRVVDGGAGMLCVLLGGISVLLARGRDGFDRGLFQGATIAFMLFGAYLLGAAIWPDTSATKDDSSDQLWLPSQDQPSLDKPSQDQPSQDQPSQDNRSSDN